MKSFTQRLMDGGTGKALEGVIYGLARRDSLRGLFLRQFEKKTMRDIANDRRPPNQLPGVHRDRRLLGLSLLYGVDRALRRGLAADAVARRFLHNVVQWYIVEDYDRNLKEKFRAEHGYGPSLVPDYQSRQGLQPEVHRLLCQLQRQP